MLTPERINDLASGPHVRRIAVENFLSTMSGDREVAEANLKLDAGLYGWNRETQAAIREGIIEKFQV